MFYRNGSWRGCGNIGLCKTGVRTGGIGERRSISGNDRLHPVVEAGVKLLSRSITEVPPRNLPGAIAERNLSPESRIDLFDFAIIEDHGMRLISKQPVAPFTIETT